MKTKLTPEQQGFQDGVQGKDFAPDQFETVFEKSLYERNFERGSYAARQADAWAAKASWVV